MAVLTFADFRSRFDAAVQRYAITWEAVGFYGPDGRVYPFGTDTKVISTVFEALAAPLISEIAEEAGYVVEYSDQTIYPDFTLSPASGELPRIAIDIKTTYRRRNDNGRLLPFRYTLGSYTSYLRSAGAAKNIKYPYHEYSDHWVIGFLYTRRAGVTAKIHGSGVDPRSLLCPYEDVAYFVQEKHKIIGLSAGSGNTANMGSFPTSDIDDLRAGRGPFAELPKELCDDYWRNYGATKAIRTYATIEQFLVWKKTKEPK